jgi:hypothetical protein
MKTKSMGSVGSLNDGNGEAGHFGFHETDSAAGLSASKTFI